MAKYHDGNLPMQIESVLRQLASLEEYLEFWMGDSGVQIVRPGQLIEIDKLRRRVVGLLNDADASTSRFTEEEIAEAMCRSKRAYTTPEAAGRGASKALANGSTDRLRVYRCPFGDHFHLTKREGWTPPGDR